MRRTKAFAETHKSIDEVAHFCGVAPATAFSYITVLASEDGEFAAMACRKFVSKCVREAVRSVDVRGPLHAVMQRVSDFLVSDPDWREQEHVFCQIGLACR